MQHALGRAVYECNVYDLNPDLDVLGIILESKTNFLKIF